MTPTLGYILAVLIVVFLVDLGLRAIPFLILEPLRESRFVRTMGVWMPAGILFILAIVSVRSSLVSAPLHRAKLGRPSRRAPSQWRRICWAGAA